MPLISVGEHAKCNLYIRDENGNLVDPSNTPVITIYSPDDIALETEEDMTPITTGTYYYPYDTTGLSFGRYRLKYKVTDGSLISILWDAFDLGT